MIGETRRILWQQMMGIGYESKNGKLTRCIFAALRALYFVVSVNKKAMEDIQRGK